MGERKRCYGCKDLKERFEGDGGTTYLCNRSPGLIVGSMNLAELDVPYEANNCHSSRAAQRDKQEVEG